MCKNVVIIWGKDGYNALGLLRQLHEYAHVIFLIYKGSKLCAVKSRYCEHLHKAESLEDGLQWLLENYASEEHKPFIISTSDIVAEFVDLNRMKLEPYFYLTGTTESGLLTRVLDKNYMNVLAKQCGFLIPKSMECRWNTDISNVNFPCLLKPDKNRRDHAKDFKTKRCDNKEELIAVLNAVDKDSVFVLQEYIPKQYDALVYGCRTMSGQIIIPGVLMKDRWDGGDGSHGYLTPAIPASINIDGISIFLKKIGFHGLFSVEYGIIGEKAYFYEFNLRNDGTSFYFAQAGCNIPLIWVLDTIGHDYSKEPLKLDGYHNYIAIIDDLQNVFSGKISFPQWIRDVKNATVFRVYDRLDNVPFYYHIMVVLLRPARNLINALLRNRKWNRNVL